MPDYTGSSSYPGSIDSFDTTKDNAEPIGQDLVNARKAIVNIETELGANPSGTDSTVVERLDNLRTYVNDQDAGILQQALDADNGPFEYTTTRTADYTIDTTDFGKIVPLNSASSKNLKIPTDANLSAPVGTMVGLMYIGAGPWIVSAVTPGTTTVNFPFGTTMGVPFVVAWVRKDGTNLWTFENIDTAGGGIPTTIIDAKGDLIVGSAADTAIRKAIGTDGQVLTADAASTGGLKWAAGGSGPDITAVYQEIITTGARITTAAGSGSKYFFDEANTADLSSSIAVATAGAAQLKILTMGTLDYAAPTGYKTVMRTRGRPLTGNTAPNVTFTIGLYPLTVSGSQLSMGTIVTGSDGAYNANTANDFTSNASADFDMPANGPYCLGYTLSGTPAANFTAYGTLQVRFVPL